MGDSELLASGDASNGVDSEAVSSGVVFCMSVGEVGTHPSIPKHRIRPKPTQQGLQLGFHRPIHFADVMLTANLSTITQHITNAAHGLNQSLFTIAIDLKA